MGTKKLLGIGVILILLLGITGCGNLSRQNNSKVQAGSGLDQSSTEKQGGAASSSGDMAGGDSSAVSRESESPSLTADPAPKTQREALAQIRSALSTKVPLMLPANIPVEKGRYLASTTSSQATKYKVNFYEVDQPARLNSKAASKGTLIATVEGTAYKNAASAKENISGYEQADTSNYGELLDLGHQIKAVEDAGAGHQFLTWNEGRWCIRVDSPNDPAYQNKEYPERTQLSKNVVAYLEDHMLPVPQKIGVVSINIWNRNNGTTVVWQDSQTVYQVSSGDPMTALKVAAAMKSK